jgi:hypothetical protein
MNEFLLRISQSDPAGGACVDPAGVEISVNRLIEEINGRRCSDVPPLPVASRRELHRSSGMTPIRSDPYLDDEELVGCAVIRVEVLSSARDWASRAAVSTATTIEVRPFLNGTTPE